MPERITRELLKKRSEHHEDELHTLREIALHQFDIVRIENLHLVPALEILLLQNNLIPRIEGLTKLKSLRYLNLALNNVTVIEGLEQNEFLEKLDLTVNFIVDVTSVRRLQANRELRELFLVGNPCTDLDGYRAYVVAAVPQLARLDGRDITRAERIEAAQEMSANRLEERIERQVLARLAEEAEKAEKQGDHAADQGEGLASADEVCADDGVKNEMSSQEDLERRREKFQKAPVPHTPETRVATAEDMAAFKATKSAKEGDGTTKAKKRGRPLFAPDGRVLQCNEGKYVIRFVTTPYTCALRMALPKHLDTSLVHVEALETRFVRVNVKGKITQLVFEEPVVPETAEMVRSRATGELLITAVRFNVKGKTGCETVDDARFTEECEAKAAKAAKNADMLQLQVQESKSDRSAGKNAKSDADKEAPQQDVPKRYKRLFGGKLDFDPAKSRAAPAVDYRNIVDATSGGGAGGGGAAVAAECLGKGLATLKIRETVRDVAPAGEATEDDDFVDNPDVPPLE